jgi:hypothetical protein
MESRSIFASSTSVSIVYCSMASKSGYIASLASHTQSCLTVCRVRVKARETCRLRVRIRVRCVVPFTEFGPSNATIPNIWEFCGQEITKCKTIAWRKIRKRRYVRTRQGSNEWDSRCYITFGVLLRPYVGQFANSSYKRVTPRLNANSAPRFLTHHFQCRTQFTLRRSTVLCAGL